jgi:hypothetical protein
MRQAAEACRPGLASLLELSGRALPEQVFDTLRAGKTQHQFCMGLLCLRDPCLYWEGAPCGT